jgi:MFS family permease
MDMLLATIALAIGLPAVLLLVRNEPPLQVIPLDHFAPDPLHAGRGFLRSSPFLMLGAALICMAIPGAGFLSQMSPLIQEEGLSASLAALGVSAYAAGQIVGRLVSGFLLDRFSPQRIGFVFTAVPALGFVLLWAFQDVALFALGAAALIGIQQGAEVDLFAYFVSRRFGLLRYGTIYGSLLGLSWVGNAIGVLSFGWVHDFTGSYQAMQIVSAVLLVLGAVLLSLVSLPARATPRPE